MSLLLHLQIPAGGPVNYADSLLVGNYVVSGKTIADSVGRVDSLSVGAYAVIGKSITDTVARIDSLSVGNYVVTGKNLEDSYIANISGGQGISSSGAMSWDGKIYTEPPVIKAQGYNRVKFDESQARQIQEAQEIIERAKTLSNPVEIFDKAVDVVDKLKTEITRLQCMEGELSVIGREFEAIRAKMAIEQMRAQIEEIDVVFVMMVISTQIH